MADRNEIEEKLKQIGTVEDDAERRTLLAELNNNLTEIFENDSKLAEENEKVKEDNEKLRQANMDLFLQVGSTKTVEQQTKDETGLEEKKEPEKRKFEDLFDGKGGLK